MALLPRGGSSQHAASGLLPRGGVEQLASGGGGTAAGVTLTATASLLAGSASGTGSGSATGVTLTATASLVAGSASGTSAATLTSSPLKDNTGTLHLSAPFEAFVLNATTGALVLRKTGLTSHASTGVVTFADAAMTSATQYRVVWRQTTTGAQGVELLTAA
jgi:trimeric autotransporter adhesin